MKNSWLIKNSSKKLLLFFNGWGMDENPFLHIKSLEYDVLMFNSYKTLDSKDLLIHEWKKYTHIDVISWSMGVWVTKFFQKYLTDINFSLAINGSFYPIDDNYGIPKDVFKLTLDNFSTIGREKFYRRMFQKKEEMVKFLEIQPKRDIIDQKQELVALQTVTEKFVLSNNFNFNNVIIGNFDKIIPAQNQIKFWQEIAQPIMIDAPHYVFFLWDKWEDLINYAKFHQQKTT